MRVSDIEIAKAVDQIAVALVASSRQRFTDLAAEAAARFGPDAVRVLKTSYHGNSNPPPEHAESFQGLGAWMTARQFAIFEIYFHLGDAALAEVRRVAFGDYDWTQGNALEILCRFAASGLQRDEILTEIKEASPDFRDEATIYAMGPLMAEKESTPALNEIIVFLRDEAGFGWAYEQVLAQQARAAAPKPTEVPPVTSNVAAMETFPAPRPWWKFW